MAGSDLSSVIPSGRVQENVPLGRLTTFQAGGPAKRFVTPESLAELTAVLRYLEERNEPYFVLGRGSNLLVSDKGYDGTVVYTRKCLNRIQRTPDGLGLEAECGVLLQDLAAKALSFGLTGLEFAHGIPGTVGGAVLMNAGAYGPEIKDVLRSARVLFPGGEIREMSPKDLGLSYRYSVLMEKKGTVLSAVFALNPGDPQEIRAKMSELMQKRKEKQPLEYASAGSTFKRPAIPGVYAGRLIQDAGLRGYACGDAQVSEKHCGFVINRGGASAAQIRRVIEDVRERVFENSGIRLEREVIYLGEF